MILYFAGSYTPRELEILAEYKCPIMQNWSTVDNTDPIWKKLRTGEIDDVIFDSGGFQMMTKVKTKRVVKPETYALWLELTLRDYPNIKYLCLDIPGDNAITMNNLAYLESCGLSPIPIWHSSNSEVYDVYLDYYCNRYDYLAIGGIANMNTRYIYRLVEYLMQRYPHMKLHLLGVGLGISRICQIYRPYSADASSWLAPARWGSELIFDGKRIRLVDMSAKDKQEIRKNDAVRTAWSRKTIHRIKEFEELMNTTSPTHPVQGNMFVKDLKDEGPKQQDDRTVQTRR